MINCKQAAGYGLCTQEVISLKKWLRGHKNLKHKKCIINIDKEDDEDCAPMRPYTILLTPSSIGIGVKVICACGARKDLAHYEHW